MKEDQKISDWNFLSIFLNGRENKSSPLDITNTTEHRIKSRVISAITDNRELLEACAISGNLITLKESSDDKISDMGEGDSDDENEEDIKDDNSDKGSKYEKDKNVISLDVIVRVVDDDTKKKKKKKTTTLKCELPDCV